MANNIHGSFLSEKISRVRWRPDFMNNSHTFLTGSWDNDQNHIQLWHFEDHENEEELYPFPVEKYPHNGDVTELKFLDADTFVSSSSFGDVTLFKISSDHSASSAITPQISWKGIHKLKCGEKSSCTGFAMYDSDIATVGEDGSINLLNAHNSKVLSKIPNADSCSIQCVIFLKHRELLTSNLGGLCKIWDLRATADGATTTFMLNSEEVTPTCLQFHPTQRHLIIAGDEEGSLTIWDLRQHTYPVNTLSTHEGSVSEIQFHPDNPDQLFSCSSVGDLWHWAPKSGGSVLNNMQKVWLASDAVKNKLDVYTIMPKLHLPINSLDINRNKLICGCDNEAVYLINGINLFN